MPFWAVARTLPQREGFAAERVGEAGFEIFAPKVRERVGVGWRVSPLFRGYLFVRVVEQWRVLERTLGVLKLVKFGDSPARCPDAEIKALLARADRDGIIRLPAHPTVPPTRIIAPGAPVTIAGGPFKGFAGLYAGMSRRDRELVLIDLLGRQTTVVVAASLVVPAVTAASVGPWRRSRSPMMVAPHGVAGGTAHESGGAHRPA